MPSAAPAPGMDIPEIIRRFGGSADTGELEQNTDLDERYWRTHIKLGFGVFLAEALAIVVYLALTPDGPHRPVLFSMAIAWFLFAAANLALASKLANKSWRDQFSVAWTVIAAFGLVGFAMLDNGFDSPVVLLLFLPISYAALSFSPLQASVCAISTLLSAGVLMFHDPGLRVPQGTLAMLLASLAGASVLSVGAAANRQRRERREKHLMREIVILGSTDGLTGCLTYRVFRERLVEEIARSRRHAHPLSLMLIDVDNFKVVNDTSGHLVGDKTLAAIGGALRTSVREIDVVGRVGGDEFAVLLLDTEPRDAVTLAERIRRKLPEAVDLPVTLSFGVSILDRSAPTAEQMLDDADTALYKAKRAGRDAVAVLNRPAPVVHHLP